MCALGPAANALLCRCSRSARACFSELDVIMRAAPTGLGGLHAVPAAGSRLKSVCRLRCRSRQRVGWLGRLARLPGSFHLATGLPIPG